MTSESTKAILENLLQHIDRVELPNETYLAEGYRAELVSLYRKALEAVIAAFD